MPPYSTLKTFVTSLKTGSTNITRCLETVVNDPAGRADQQRVNAIGTPGALDAASPAWQAWLSALLAGAGMTGPEVDHIRGWPDAQKEEARAEIASAIAQSRDLRFAWELHGGPEPVTELRPDTAGGLTTVAFRSPRSGVHLSPVNFGTVRVEA